MLNVAFMRLGRRLPSQAASGLTSRAEEHPDAAIFHAVKMLKKKKKKADKNKSSICLRNDMQIYCGTEQIPKTQNR